MRNLRVLDHFRQSGPEILAHYGNAGDHTCGVFEVPSCIDKSPLRIVASSDGAWDHVSVSRVNRCPNWPEMEQIKRLFFREEETAMQLHVPTQDHISVHPHCLHIWRPQNAMIPLPPKEFVA